MRRIRLALGIPRLLLRQADPFTAVWLGLLMLLSALTEGIGILLLVPMLHAMGNSDDMSLPGKWLAAVNLQATVSTLLAIFVGLIAFRALVNLARALTSRKFQAEIVDGLRNRVFSALLHCEWRVVSAMRRTDSESLLISNIDRIGNGVNQLAAAFAAAVTLLGVGAAALAISPGGAVVAMAGGALMLFTYRGLGRRAAQLGDRMSAAYRQMHARLSESLGALRVIKSFGREEQARQQVAGSFRSLRDAERRFLRDSGFARLALEVATALLAALLVWLAVERWNQGPADILPFVALIGRALPLLSVLQSTWQNWAHARPAIDEVAAIIAEAEAAREPDGDDQALAPPQQAIVIDNATVHFQGRSAAALDGVNLVIPARGMIALTGPSGAGKSTLADLAGGLIAPDQGSVRIDTIELGDSYKRAWRRSVAYVQQEPVLFTGTIRENLLWAEPQANVAQLHDVLTRASALFVEELPDGLDTMVGEGGRQLSGGERQRIILARALLRRPALLILDEATSALDAENEAAIVAALECLRGDMAVLIICHRGVLQSLADCVVRLENGRIVATEGRTCSGE